MVACGKAIGRSADRCGLIERIVRQRERDLLLGLDRHDTECGFASVEDSELVPLSDSLDDLRK
jgi:hypothetical protein